MIPTITRGDAMIDVDTLPACPVETTLTLISDKWKILIVRDLLTGTKRFNELMRSVTGITQKVLTSHLRAMEAAAWPRQAEGATDTALLIGTAFSSVAMSLDFVDSLLDHS